MTNDRYQVQNVLLKNGILSNVFPNIIAAYKGGWILDVGSNTGIFIECLLDKFPNASILVFEPVQRYFAYSYQRFRNKENVFIENLALSDADRWDDIFVAEQNIGWNTMVKQMTNADNAGTKERIRSISFDKYYGYTGIGKNGAKFDIVKIDTEGYEYKVLMGMKYFLREQKPTILCEIGWGCNHPHWAEELAAFEYLYSIGYSREHEQFIKGLQATTDVIFTCP